MNKKLIYIICVVSLILNVLLIFGLAYFINKVQRSTDIVTETEIDTNKQEESIEKAEEKEIIQVPKTESEVEFSILVYEDGKKRCTFPGNLAVTTLVDQEWECYSSSYNETNEEEYLGAYIKNSISDVTINIITDIGSFSGGCNPGDIDGNCEYNVVYEGDNYNITQVTNKSPDGNISNSYTAILAFGNGDYPIHNPVDIFKKGGKLLSQEDIKSVVKVIDNIKGLHDNPLDRIDQMEKRMIELDKLRVMESKIIDLEGGDRRCIINDPLYFTIDINNKWECEITPNDVLGGVSKFFLKSTNDKYSMRFMEPSGGEGYCWGSNSCSVEKIFENKVFTLNETVIKNEDIKYEYSISFKEGSKYPLSLDFAFLYKEDFGKLSESEIVEIEEVLNTVKPINP